MPVQRSKTAMFEGNFPCRTGVEHTRFLLDASNRPVFTQAKSAILLHRATILDPEIRHH